MQQVCTDVEVVNARDELNHFSKVQLPHDGKSNVGYRANFGSARPAWFKRDHARQRVQRSPFPTQIVVGYIPVIS